jgi:zinc D-Ala-D-Ala carboxypeptidase
VRTGACAGRRTRTLAGAWLVASLLPCVSLGSPAHAQAVAPCTVAERVLAIDADASPELVLVDPAWRLPPGYAPRDLVSVGEAGFSGDHLVRTVVIDDLRALREAAELAGVRLAIQSAYRSEAYQARVHEGWVRQLGAARAAEVSARPGHSEHQLGTAIDVRSASGPPAWELDDWATTPEGAWVAAHAHRFGFVVSYPRDARAESCYDYEPWHLRWVGRTSAAAATAAAVPYRLWLLHHQPPTEAP